jgi:predicted GNAT family acetyltransferase
VVAAAARAVLAEGRAVLYNHAPENHASARVAESVGLHELGRYHAVVPDRRLAAEFGEDDTV